MYKKFKNNLIYKIVSIVIINVLLLPAVSFGRAFNNSDTLSPSVQINSDTFQGAYLNLNGTLAPLKTEQEIAALFDGNESWRDNQLVADMADSFKRARKMFNPQIVRRDARQIERILDAIDVDAVDNVLPIEGKRLLYYFLILKSNNYARLNDPQRSSQALERAVNIPGVFVDFDNYYNLVYIFNKEKDYEKAVFYAEKALAVVNTLPSEEISEAKWGIYAFYYASLLDNANTIKTNAFDLEQGSVKKREFRKAREAYVKAISALEEIMQISLPSKENQAIEEKKRMAATMVSCYAQIVSIDNELDAPVVQLKQSLLKINNLFESLLIDAEQSGPQFQYLAGKLSVQVLQSYMRLISRIAKSRQRVEAKEFFPAKYFEQFADDFDQGVFNQDLKAMADSNDEAACSRVLNALIKNSSISRRAVSFFRGAKKNFAGNQNFSDMLLLLIDMELQLGMFSQAEQDMGLLCKKSPQSVRDTDKVQSMIFDSYIVDKDNTINMVEKFLTDKSTQRPILNGFKEFKAMDNEQLRQMLETLAVKNKRINNVLISFGLLEKTKQASHDKKQEVKKQAQSKELTSDEQLIFEVDKALKNLSPQNNVSKKTKNKKGRAKPGSKIKQQDIDKFRQALINLAVEFRDTGSNQLLEYLQALINNSLLHNKETLARIVTGALEIISNEQGLALLDGFRSSLEEAKVPYVIDALILPAKEKILEAIEVEKQKEAQVQSFVKDCAKQSQVWEQIYKKMLESNTVEILKLLYTIRAEEPVMPDDAVKNDVRVEETVNSRGNVYDKIEAFAEAVSYVYSFNNTKRIKVDLTFDDKEDVWSLSFVQFVPEIKYISEEGRQEIRDIFIQADKTLKDFDITVQGVEKQDIQNLQLLQATIEDIAAEEFDIAELKESSLGSRNAALINKIKAYLIEQAI